MCKKFAGEISLFFEALVSLAQFLKKQTQIFFGLQRPYLFIYLFIYYFFGEEGSFVFIWLSSDWKLSFLRESFEEAVSKVVGCSLGKANLLFLSKQAAGKEGHSRSFCSKFHWVKMMARLLESKFGSTMDILRINFRKWTRSRSITLKWHWYISQSRRRKTFSFLVSCPRSTRT